MRRTVLRGQPVVHWGEIVGVIRREVTSNGKKKKVSFPKAVWEEIMESGFASYPVGKLLDRGNKNARVQFAAPPSNSDPVALRVYHNNLMNLCQIGARRFADLLGAFAAKRPPPEGARQGGLQGASPDA
eukprot:11215302-Lingulodinium_polyedra.AAC.1